MSHAPSEEKALIVRKTLVPSPVPEAHQQQQQQANYNWVVRIWHALLGHTVNDIARLKEAGFQKIELTNELTKAEALQKMAQAEKDFAEAEKIRQEAALKWAEAEKEQAEAYAMRMKAIADATEQIAEAISGIRQQGGEVSFDLEQLAGLIREGSRRYPDDPALKDAARQLPEASDDG